MEGGTHKKNLAGGHSQIRTPKSVFYMSCRVSLLNDESWIIMVDGWWMMNDAYGWRWMTMDDEWWLWMIVDDCGWLWMMDDGWLWMIVDGCGWWMMNDEWWLWMIMDDYGWLWMTMDDGWWLYDDCVASMCGFFNEVLESLSASDQIQKVKDLLNNCKIFFITKWVARWTKTKMLLLHSLNFGYLPYYCS